MPTPPAIKTSSPVPLTAGQFPPLPAEVAPIWVTRQAENAVRLTLKYRDITCFDGVTGTGKTTAATLAVTQIQQAMDSGTDALRWVYCVPPQRANPKAMMSAVYEAVLHRPAPGTERTITDVLIDRLAEGDIGLVVDEVHHVGVIGMQQLRHLWDRTALIGKPVPLLMVGVNVYPSLDRAREVRNRVARWVQFHNISDTSDDLATFVHVLHPRLAVTPTKVIESINAKVTQGGLRDWFQFAKHIDELPSTSLPGKPKPLTRDDINLLNLLTGRQAA